MFQPSIIIVSLPRQDRQELVGCLRLASGLPLVGCSVSRFIAGSQTPLENAAAPDADSTLNSMAAVRLRKPDWVIPAAVPSQPA